MTSSSSRQIQMFKIIFPIIISLFFLTTSVIIVFSAPGFITLKQIYQNISSNSVTEFGETTFRLVVGQADTIEIRFLEGQYTISEYKHLVDVLFLVDYAKLVWVILTLALISGLVYLENWYNFIKTALCFNFVGIILFAAFGIFFWTEFFVLFHQLLFPPGTWTFPVDSLLIQNFPVVFWQISAAFLVVVFILLNLIAFIASSTSQKLSRSPQE